MRLGKKKLTSTLALLVIFLIVSYLQQKGFVRFENNSRLSAAPTIQKNIAGVNTQSEVSVKKVIDGDTIQLSTGQKVRYIGVNTPETKDPRRGVQCFGKEAAARNKELVEGKVVRLEKDVSETDKYGRLLRFVYLKESTGSGELFINDLLVKEGYAYASSYPPDISKQQLFRVSQIEAQKNNLGLWGKCPK